MKNKFFTPKFAPKWTSNLVHLRVDINYVTSEIIGENRMYIVYRNMVRNKRKSLITIWICVFLVVSINVYLGNMQSNREQLNQLSETIPVYCQVTNLNGSLSTGIWIDEELAQKLLASDQVKDAVYGIRMMGGIGGFQTENRETLPTLNVEGVSGMEAVPGLSRENLSLDVTLEQFFESSAPTCVVSSALMEEYQWKLGQEISLRLYYYDYDEEEGIQYFPLEILNVAIAGEMDSVVSNGDVALPDILLPVGLVKECYERKHISFQPSYFSFYVANPFRLNDFKAEMKSLGLMEKNAMAGDSYEGCALEVRDRLYISLASKLQKTIRIFEGFRVILFITIAGVSYIASTLLMESRRQEFALMRALGSGAVRCIACFWAEQLFLALFGFLIGDAVCLLFQNIKTVFVSDAMIAVSYMTGCAAALLILGRRSAMKLLFDVQ